MSDPHKVVRPASPSPSIGHAANRSAAAANRDVHILDRLAVLYRYRRVAAAVFALTAAAVMIQGYSHVRMFQAQARLLIEDERRTAVPGITSQENTYWEDPLPYYQTQYRILKGRDLTRRVVKRVDLGSVAEFNGTAEPPLTPVAILQSLRQRVVAMVKPPPPAHEETPKADETADESALVSAFISRVQVVPVQDSRLVDVFFLSTDAAFAARAVNALVEEYVAQNLEVKLQGTQSMLQWLEGELAAQQQKVEQSERELADYRERENAMSLDDKNNIVLSRLTALNEALVRTRTTRIEKESLHNQVKAISAATSPDAIPVIAQNPQIQGLKNHLAELQRQKAEMAERYGDKHPEMQKVNAQLADARRQLDVETSKALQAVKNEYDRALLEERTLAANLEQAKADVQTMSKASVSYNVMEREARSHRIVYEALLQRANELRVSSNSRSNNVRIIDPAEVPRAPVTPTGRRTWLLSLAVGLVAAIAVAYGLDYMNDTIKTPEDLTRYLKVPFLGLIPSVRRHQQPALASARAPEDFNEAFRSVRTALHSQYTAQAPKTLVVTSAQPLEGKTTTACNIAMALAYGGARVLLVDADMRRPGLHHSLQLRNDQGLSHVLTGQVRVRDVIQRTVDPNLFAVTAGPPPPNPSELLTSERMKTLLVNLVHGPFDWIVIDTPPVLAVTDAVILAPLVSGVTFVVGSEMTRRRLAERAVETILSSSPKMLSAVLNKVDIARNRYYYSRYYGQGYKGYYARAS